MSLVNILYQPHPVEQSVCAVLILFPRLQAFTLRLPFDFPCRIRHRQVSAAPSPAESAPRRTLACEIQCNQRAGMGRTRPPSLRVRLSRRTIRKRHFISKSCLPHERAGQLTIAAVDDPRPKFPVPDGVLLGVLAAQFCPVGEVPRNFLVEQQRAGRESRFGGSGCRYRVARS